MRVLTLFLQSSYEIKWKFKQILDKYLHQATFILIRRPLLFREKKREMQRLPLLPSESFWKEIMQTLEYMG
jgi:hypothetical protein